MKKLFLLMIALVAVVGTPLSVLADDHADHNWNDEYWHHNKSGYWHGHKGHWEHRDNKPIFIQVG